MIELDGVSFRYPGGETALSDVSMRLEAGEKVVLLGANGSGKSTLLRILDALEMPQAGTFRFRGEAVSGRRLRNKAWARDFRRRVVLLFQNPEAMLFNPTVHDEIAFGLRRAGVEGVEERVRSWAHRLDLSRRLSASPLALSQGEKQRTCLAALLVLEPEVLLMDEPTSSLDPRSTGWLVDLLEELPATVVTSTHNLSLAAELGGRALVLGEDHRLISDQPTAETLADTETLYAANLMHTHRHRHGALEHRHYHLHDWD
ncbi:energy-coupling factor ABC transporter ATP-binding protein [Thiohalorhabdus sp. Cl-TMA]|uniref:Energy-coupling factor ABC transporter ATP-binding protein n=1 Tax=Thiohalorhabdus methylotrophus TaxID=3242694 RepID=A0ABV4TW61_9GAMM